MYNLVKPMKKLSYLNKETGHTHARWPEDSGYHSSNKVYQSILEAVGNTPLVKLNRIPKDHGLKCDIYINTEMKHPKILSTGSRLGTLLINQAHELTFHGGPRLTLATLRQKYWITGGNNTVKKELRKCIRVTCLKQGRKPQHQLMRELPAARTNHLKRFVHTSVDYTGFEIKAHKGRGAKTVKGYVAIFISMVTKAIYLELVTDLTSSAFLAALRRMTARKGAPQHLYNDNGTNFVGANPIQEESQHLQHLLSGSFLSEVTEMNIEWHFNAPSWPSAGGLWERAVRSLKHHLRRVADEKNLTFEECATILAQIEACLNSRPLCALTENGGDLDFLSPAHFLIGRAGLTVIQTAEDARTRWHLCQKIILDIWKRWKSEYLTQLVIRQKWQQPQINFEIGDIAVIHEDNLPPRKWALGRVTEIYPGNDGSVRVISLKTKNRIIQRPVPKLSMLPLEKQSAPSAETTKYLEDNKPRRRAKQSFVSMALMFMYFTTLLTSAYAFNVTNLNAKQKIYFDKVANMQLIRDEWKIIAYYDLNPYWETIATYNKYYKHLNSTCYSSQHSSQCDLIMLQLRHVYDELERNNANLLEHQTGALSRRKHGFLNVVGNLANTFFGVLDDRFAEQYQRDIALVRHNEKHLALLWKNQMSIVEAKHNILKRTEEALQKQLEIVNKYLNISANSIRKQMNEQKYLTEFTLSAMAATNILSHLRNVQNNLLETLTSIHNGKVNIHIINPQQLQKELSVITGQLAKDLIIPVDNLQTNMQNIYHLLSINSKMTKQYVIFEIKVPLISRDNYVLYHILAIPYQLGKSIVTVSPIADHVAINLHKDSYLPISGVELQHCMSRDPSMYLCKLKTPIYKIKSDNDFCIRNDNQINHCSTNIVTCQEKWTSLAKINQYLYFCCTECLVRTLCGDRVTAHQLTGTNIINIETNCEVKTENFTIYTHNHLTNNINLENYIQIPYIAPINHVINITAEPLKEDNQFDNNRMLIENIDERIKNMRQQEPLSENISVHDVHHYALIYTILGVIGVVAVTIACQRVSRRSQATAALAAAGTPEGLVAGPQPAARPSRTGEHSDVLVPSVSARVQINEPRYTERGTYYPSSDKKESIQ